MITYVEVNQTLLNLPPSIDLDKLQEWCQKQKLDKEELLSFLREVRDKLEWQEGKAVNILYLKADALYNRMKND